MPSLEIKLERQILNGVQAQASIVTLRPQVEQISTAHFNRVRGTDQQTDW